MSAVRRRELIMIAGCALAWPLTALPQQKQMPVIGFLGVGSPGGFAAEVEAFERGLEGSGWAIGKNVTIEYRWAEGAFDRLPGLAAALVDRGVSVIATSGGALAARAAKNGDNPDRLRDRH